MAMGARLLGRKRAVYPALIGIATFAILVGGDFSVLLTGDSGLPSEAVWLRSRAPLASTVLKIGHHGSNSATSPAFVRAGNPAVNVIQVGAENDYGHPTEEVLATLGGRVVLRNDLHGRIHVATDGEQMWIATQAGKPTLK